MVGYEKNGNSWFKYISNEVSVITFPYRTNSCAYEV